MTSMGQAERPPLIGFEVQLPGLQVQFWGFCFVHNQLVGGFNNFCHFRYRMTKVKIVSHCIFKDFAADDGV